MDSSVREERIHEVHVSECPHCGAPVGSGTVCEYCGSVLPHKTKVIKETRVTKGTEQPQENKQAYYQEAVYTEQPRKRRTWLWVLGWIFCFPIPLLILVWRSDRLKLPVKIVITVLMFSLLSAAGS